MKNVLLVALLFLFAAVADAACLKCDQSTGYRCFMSVNGTKLNCDSPSNAGCFTWGVCSTTGSDCGEGCILNPTGVAVRMSELHVASVTVVCEVQTGTNPVRKG